MKLWNFTDTKEVAFNPSKTRMLHIDINSCFATIEQQANPFLRNKPIAVSAYVVPSACILSPSKEAKQLGIKVGMHNFEGKRICPSLIILAPDPWKYRFINRKLLHLLQSYSHDIQVKSIDEMVLDVTCSLGTKDTFSLARQMKSHIKSEIGNWITVSIGISTNTYLAKVASSLHKPDGFDEITISNFQRIFSSLPVEKLCGVKQNNKARLNRVGIFTVLDMYHASVTKLTCAFQSIFGYYWFLRLHGYEIDDIGNDQKSYGQSYVLPQPSADNAFLSQLVCQLVEKMGKRLREAHLCASGIYIGCMLANHAFWGEGKIVDKKMYSSSDLYKEVMKYFLHRPITDKIKTLAVSCFRLENRNHIQLSLLQQEKETLTDTIDVINARFGDFTLKPARMMGIEGTILDRIAFGSIKNVPDISV